MGAAIRFKNLTLPRQAGEYARLRVLQGPDYGQVFVVTGSRLTVGRGEDNDVVVSDLKSSRKHAEFRYEATGWKVQDLGSANGILHNGKATRAAPLRAGDTVTLGETTLEFLTSDVDTQILTAPPGRALAVVETARAAESALEVHRQKVRAVAKSEAIPAAALFNNVNGVPGTSGSGANNKRLFIYGGLGLLVLAMFAMEETPDPKAAQKGSKDKAGAVGKAPKAGDDSLVAAPRDLSGVPDGGIPIGGLKLPPEAEAFFKAGFREFREKNYLRAKSNFENVLMINPSHELSQKYLTNATKAIEDLVRTHLERGRKNSDSGRLKFAKGHYEAVLRLLHWNDKDPSYQAAKEELEKVERRMKGEGT